jgi:uncharacterized membrane protein
MKLKDINPVFFSIEFAGLVNLYLYLKMGSWISLTCFIMCQSIVTVKSISIWLKRR